MQGVDYMAFADKLRSLIEEHNITQKQLAINLNIAPSTLGNYVQGVREPDFKTLIQLANYFKVSIDYLLGYNSDTTISNSEAELLQIYRSMDNKEQRIFLEQGKVFLRLKSR